MRAEYTIELRKHIVVTVVAESEADARALAADNDHEWDGAWQRAEPDVVCVLNIEELT